MCIRDSLYCVANKGEEVSADDIKNAQAEDKEEEEQPQRRRGFDPGEMFDRMDADKDGNLVETEYADNPMAERMKTLDKDESGGISKEEFTTGIRSLFRRGGGGRGGAGGRGAAREDSRPDRPQRPKMAEEG